ncbi:hypothetical protein [Chamaesiphon sp.]|uniref:hypothetical protein n=1 Tax=Chamaesiphon sp. TaxID=2814140 RepID=UPI00359364EA
MTQTAYDSNKIAIRALSRGIGTKLFNQQVVERYGDNTDLMDACKIQDWDTMPEMVFKQLTYFFTLSNFTPVFEEKIHLRNKPLAKDRIAYPWMMIHLKFKERYIKVDGVLKPIGQRRIKISNIDPAKIDSESIAKAFKDVFMIYGNNYCTYNFNNGKEIRLEHVSTQAKGIELISLFLPFTDTTTHQKGEIADNILTVSKPKNTPKVDTTGLKGYVYKITIHERQGKKVNQIFRVMIENGSRD